MFCAGRVVDEDLKRTLKACGGAIQTTVNNMTDDVLGRCELFGEEQMGGERYIMYRILFVWTRIVCENKSITEEDLSYKRNKELFELYYYIIAARTGQPPISVLSFDFRISVCMPAGKLMIVSSTQAPPREKSDL